tara:strand:+ start:378 stop:800 length:423 start_codon:yes stop_codon:yes gene_type:complete
MPDDDIGIGPRSIAPGGFNGIRTSSPYDDPLTCQNPTWGVSAKTKKLPLRHNVTIPSREAGDSIAPQITMTTFIAAKTRKGVSKLDRGTRDIRRPKAHKDHSPIIAVIWTERVEALSALSNIFPPVNGRANHATLKAHIR